MNGEENDQYGGMSRYEYNWVYDWGVGTIGMEQQIWIGMGMKLWISEADLHSGGGFRIYFEIGYVQIGGG